MKSLNAFLVHKCCAEEYIRWKGDDWMIENKNCGTCKHLQIDGMFGMWCDLDKDWENVEYCSDWER